MPPGDRVATGTGEAAFAGKDRRRLALALSGNALQRIAAGASAVLAGLYLARLTARHAALGTGFGAGFGAGLAGALGAVAFAAEVVAAVPLGVLADLAPPRRIMALGSVLGGLSVLGFGLSTWPAALFATRAAEGVGAAAVTPPLLAHLTHMSRRDPALRARAMSLFELSLLGGIALGGLLGAELWARLQTAAFGAVAAAYGVAALLLYAGAPGRPPPHDAGHAAHRSRAVSMAGPVSDLVRALRNAQLRRLVPVWLCMNAIVGLWLGPTLAFLLTRRPLTGQFLDGVFAAHTERVGWMLLGYSLVFGAGVAAWSRVLPRIALPRALRVTLLAMLGVSGELLAFNHLAWPPARWPLAGVTAVTIMVESGFSPAALALLAGALGAEAGGGGAAMGIYSALLGIGAAFGSGLAAALGVAFGVDGLVYGTAALAGLALLALKRLRPANPVPERAADRTGACKKTSPTTSS